MLIQRVAAALASLFAALCFQTGAAGQTGGGQTVGGGFFGDHDIRTNSQQGLLQIQPLPAGGNGFSGTAFGQPVSGYYASTAKTAVWLELSQGQPARAYVASTSRQSMSGVMYALGSTHGASVMRNSFAFVTTARPALINRFNPARPLVEPAVPGAVTVLGQTASWITANGHQGVLVMQIDAAGNLVGRVFHDEIRGHYASGAGVVAFVRFSAGVPIQFFHGTFSPQAGGQLQPTLAGQFYPLTEAAGASPQAIRFAMSATSGQGFTSYRPTFGAAPHGWCLMPQGRSTAPAAHMVIAACEGVADQMALIAGPDGFRYMVLRESGLCIGFPGGATSQGTVLQQNHCSLGASQRIRLGGFGSGTGFQLRAVQSDLCLTMGAPPITAVTRGVVELRACDPMVDGNSFISF